MNGRMDCLMETILSVVCRIEGEWKNGLLNGEIKANIINTGWIEGYYK